MDIELVNAVQDAQFLSAINQDNDAKTKKRRKLPSLPEYSTCIEIEKSLKEKGDLTFEKIYWQPIGRRLFRQFCMTQVPSLKDRALVMFEVQVETYREKERSLREACATDTYDMFIKKHSPASIDITAEDFEEISKKFEEKSFEIDIFDNIQKRNAATLEKIHFENFLKSKFFKRFIQWKKLESEPIGDKNFLLYRVLGRGGFGEVHACQKRDSGKMYAVKMLDKKRVKKNGDKTAFNERSVLAKVDSRFIVGLKYAYCNKRYLALVLDLLQGGDLQFHLIQEGRFEPKRTEFYLASICLALNDLHAAGVVYRDLKPENVLLDESGFVKVSDLGLATDFKTARRSMGKVGTPGYLAPEMIDGKRHGYCVDWFSFGCCMYKFISGRSPFRTPENGDTDTSVPGIYKRTVEFDPPFPEKYFSADAKDLCSRLLDKNVQTRIGCGGFENANGAVEIKKHPYFKNTQWEELENGLVTEAPFVPSKYMVNAESLVDMKQMSSVKDVKLTDEDEEAYKKFPITISRAWQQEMIDSSAFHEINHLNDQVIAERRFSVESYRKLKKMRSGHKEGADCVISNPQLRGSQSEDEGSISTI